MPLGKKYDKNKRAWVEIEKERALDYEQYGGAALLGVTGALVKAHGSSNARAYSCAIRQARSMVEGNVVGIIAQQLKSETADA